MERRVLAGYILFAGLAIAAAGAAFAAFSSTGEMGIEERFTHAVGLSGDDSGTGDPQEETGAPVPEISGAHEADNGFFLEGNPVLYSLVLVLLVAACCIMYRRYRV